MTSTYLCVCVGRREPAPLPSLSRPAGALAAWSTHPIHPSPGGVRRAPSTSFDPRSVRTGADVAQLLLGEEPLPPDTPCVFYLNLAEWRGAPASSLAQGWYRPYDLVVVPRAATSPEHFTITASGVTHLRPEQPSEVRAARSARPSLAQRGPRSLSADLARSARTSLLSAYLAGWLARCCVRLSAFVQGG